MQPSRRRTIFAAKKLEEQKIEPVDFKGRPPCPKCGKVPNFFFHVKVCKG